MKRSLKICAGALALVLLAGLAGLLVLRTAWFQQKLRQRVMDELGRATGGRVEIAAMHFDSRIWRARLDGVTIHGLEEAGQKPLLHAAAIQVDLKILSFLKRQVNIAALRVETPEIRVSVAADGSTNIPGPQQKVAQGRLITEDLIDLDVGRFELEQGTVWWNDRRFPLEFVLERLHTQVHFEPGGRYAGSLEAVGAAFAAPPRLPPVDHLAAKFQVFRDRIQIDEAFAGTARSQIRASGTVTNLLEPHSQFTYNATVDAREASRFLLLPELKSGVARVEGSLDSQGDKWSTQGKLAGHALAVQGDGFRVSNAAVDAEYRLDPRQIRAQNVTARLLGGAWRGSVTADYGGHASIEGRAEGIRLEAAAQALPGFPVPLQKLGWTAVIGGPVAVHGLCPSFCRDLVVEADLVLATPEQPGSLTPVSGVLRGAFHDRRSEAEVDELRLALPGASLTASGRIGKTENGVRFHVDATRLDDLIAAGSALSGENIDVPIELKGRAAVEGRLFGSLDQPQVDATLNASRFSQQGREWDALTFRAQFSLQRLRLIGGRLTKGKTAVNGNLLVGLENGRFSARSPLQADVSLRDTDVQDLAALAGQKIPASGAVTAAVKIEGTENDLRGAGRVEIRRGAALPAVWGEPFDSAHGSLVFEAAEVRLNDFQMTKGGNVLSGSASFDRQQRAFRFSARSDKVSLGDWRLLAKSGSAFSGNGSFNLSGSGRLAANLRDVETFAMEGEAGLRKIAVDREPLGDVSLSVREEAGKLRVHVQSDFANAQITGDGEITPTGRFPVQGRIEFRNVNAASVLKTLQQENLPAAVSADGEVSIAGEVQAPEALTLAGTLTRLSVDLPENAAAPRLRQLRNPEPVKWRVAGRTLTIESAHLVGEGSDLRCSGSVAIGGAGAVNLAMKGSLNMAVLGSLGPNLNVEGVSVVDAVITGQVRQPDIRGNLEIRKASVGSEDLPLSLSNINGAVLFSRYAATIQKLTGESGGGQISVSGEASFLPGRPVTYRLRADASQIRLRYPAGISSLFDGALTFTGTNQQSLLGGDIRITRAATRAAVDLVTLLASLKEPVRTPSRNDWLQDAQLNVTISTAPDIRFDTSLARNLQADASLRLRGTVLNPALLGRITLTQGEFQFQGTRYTIEHGDITFANPIHIEPILNLDLRTRTGAYDIVLTLTGPVQKLNVSYRSDPPLPFNEVIALLALGRSPTSDASLAAQQLEQTQGLAQIGASGIVGEAISQPVSGRLQRLFGVSRLKLDPELVGPEGNPNARVTLEQQMSKDVTFTYIYNLASVQEQIVRVQWALSPQLSVIAVRDQNGVFGVDFLYRKRFR